MANLDYLGWCVAALVVIASLYVHYVSQPAVEPELRARIEAQSAENASFRATITAYPRPTAVVSRLSCIPRTC